MTHYDNQGRRVLGGNPSTWEDEAKALRAENDSLKSEIFGVYAERSRLISALCDIDDLGELLLRHFDSQLDALNLEAIGRLPRIAREALYWEDKA